MDTNMAFSCTSHIHDHETDFQGEKPQLDLLGDVGINSLAPVLIPSPGLSTSRTIIPEATTLSLSRRTIIRICRHYWVKLEGELEQRRCELCGGCQ